MGCAKILLFAMDQRMLVLIRPLLIPYWEPNRIRWHKGNLCRRLLLLLAWVFNVIFPKPKACLGLFENFKVHTSSQPFSLRVPEWRSDFRTLEYEWVVWSCWGSPENANPTRQEWNHYHNYWVKFEAKHFIWVYQRACPKPSPKLG